MIMMTLIFVGPWRTEGHAANATAIRNQQQLKREESSKRRGFRQETLGRLR
jgi:hypothetical protein